MMKADKKSRILIVDDEQIVLETMGKLLSTYGYEIEAVTSPREALEKIDTSPPDLILSDLNMPESSGLEFLSMLREKNVGTRVPVIFVTAMTRPEDRLACLSAGASDFIPKPVDPEILLESVEAQLES